MLSVEEKANSKDVQDLKGFSSNLVKYTVGNRDEHYSAFVEQALDTVYQ